MAMQPDASFRFGDEETPPDPNEDWSLTVDDDAAVVVPTEPATAALAPVSLVRAWIGWAGKGLLLFTFFLGSFFAGLHQFGALDAIVPPVAQKVSKEGKAVDPPTPVDMPPMPPIVLVNKPKQRADPPDINKQDAPPVRLPPVDNDARPKARVSLYEHVRQVVLENKTEETERLGLGDVAYQSVPDDGSIMVGMEVSYAPFFTHQIIKSVRPIFQRPDGTRYDGSVCGKPTGVGERVVAREGYAIGGASIRSGLGIDAMQLTFMEIGPDGLNPGKAYLSKWLGMNGGADARTFVNDGRPIIGIAGMWSRSTHSPAFCICFVTTPHGAPIDAAAPR